MSSHGIDAWKKWLLRKEKKAKKKKRAHESSWMRWIVTANCARFCVENSLALETQKRMLITYPMMSLTTVASVQMSTYHLYLSLHWRISFFSHCNSRIICLNFLTSVVCELKVFSAIFWRSSRRVFSQHRIGNLPKCCEGTSKKGGTWMSVVKTRHIVHVQFSGLNEITYLRNLESLGGQRNREWTTEEVKSWPS